MGISLEAALCVVAMEKSAHGILKGGEGIVITVGGESMLSLNMGFAYRERKEECNLSSISLLHPKTYYNISHLLPPPRILSQSQNQAKSTTTIRTYAFDL